MYIQVFLAPKVDLLEQVEESTTAWKRCVGDSVEEAMISEKDKLELRKNMETGSEESKKC